MTEEVKPEAEAPRPPTANELWDFCEKQCAEARLYRVADILVGLRSRQQQLEQALLQRVQSEAQADNDATVKEATEKSVDPSDSTTTPNGA